MTSGGMSKPGPSASPPLTRETGRAKTGRSEHRRGRAPAIHPQAGVTLQCSGSVSTVEESKTEFTSVISEIFKEDIAYRTQARKFLWEFFD